MLPSRANHLEVELMTRREWLRSSGKTFHAGVLRNPSYVDLGNRLYTAATAAVIS